MSLSFVQPLAHCNKNWQMVFGNFSQTDLVSFLVLTVQQTLRRHCEDSKAHLAVITPLFYVRVCTVNAANCGQLV